MFVLEKKLENSVRVGKLTTAHGVINTPFFMPVGTVGSVKSMAPSELKQLGAEIVLANTYHLYLRPGEKTVKDLGGLHRFMNWNGPILTDSGGYQVFSLSRGNKHDKSVIPTEAEGSFDEISPTPMGGRNDNTTSSMVKISEDGVEFRSHLDGSSHFFTPEKVIDIQLDLGVDILMPLDVCPSGKASLKEIEHAVELTIKWAQRSKVHFESRIKNYESGNRPLLHGIVQGGLDLELRKYCTDELIKLDFDGYSVGGLAVDFETRDMWEIVRYMGEILPENKQRYLMGVGTPDDLIKATKLGMDMFDCVLPTRLARHGSVYRRINSDFDIRASNFRYELVNLLKNEYRRDGGVIDENCGCVACAGEFSRAYISHLLRSKEILGIRLATTHNLCQYLELMKELRNSA